MAASTIIRFSIVDDDGSGTTGTFEDSAWFNANVWARIDEMFSGTGTYTTFELGGKLKVDSTAQDSIWGLGGLKLTGIAAPAVSAAGTGVMYYDTATYNAFCASYNGGAYLPIALQLANATFVTLTTTTVSGAWNGTAIGAQYGGTGLNTSASSGVPSINSGTWAINNVLTTDHLLFAAASNTIASVSRLKFINSGGGAGSLLVSVPSSTTTWGASNAEVLRLQNTQDTDGNWVYMTFAGTTGTLAAAIGAKLIDSGNGTADLHFYVNTVDAMTIFSTGGVNVGAPTGGDKGAGTINCVACYDDNVILTDYLWDLHYDGQVRPEDATRWGDARIWNLAETRIFTQHQRHLPTLPGRAEWKKAGPKSTGEMITALWATVEQQQIHIFDLEDRLEDLSARVN